MERSCFPVNVPCCIGITVYILFAAAVSARKVAENTEALVQAMNVVGSNFHIALKARYGVLPVSELSFGNPLISVSVNTVYHIAAVVFSEIITARVSGMAVVITLCQRLRNSDKRVVGDISEYACSHFGNGARYDYKGLVKAAVCESLRAY